MEHDFSLKNGVWWCNVEDVISDECTDYDRCNNTCVCNDSDEEER